MTDILDTIVVRNHGADKGQAGLAGKLCSIMGELENLPKNGRNEFHKYDYVREADVVNGIRALLSKHGVFIFHEVVSMDLEESGGANSKPQRVAKVWTRYTFVDSATGYERSVLQLGFGQDTGEKGYYKALAGAHKYFLMKTFNVSAGDDPEETPNKEEKKQFRAPPPPSSTKKVNPYLAMELATEAQRKKLWAMMKEAKVSQDDLKTEMKALFDKDSTKLLTKAEIQQLFKLLEPKP